jgi:hypothetical protein
MGFVHVEVTIPNVFGILAPRMQPGVDGKRTCHCGGTQVYYRVLSPAVEFMCDNLFPIAVGVKVDAPGWNNTDQGRTQALEERRDAFISIYVSAIRTGVRESNSGTLSATNRRM